MIKVKFNTTDVFFPVSFSRHSEHVVTLIGNVPATAVGFRTYRMNSDEQLGDFSEFNTVYRVLPDGCQYSNDGSVWHEPESVPPAPDPTPSWQDRIEAQMMYTAMMTDTLLEE